MFRYITFFLLLILVLFWFIYKGHINDRQQVLLESYHTTINQIKESIHKYKVNSDVTFENLIRSENIINLLEKSTSQDKETLKIIRESLYFQLKQPYENLKKIADVRQLHFHLPNGHSFLRMHRPDKFGDPLFDVRYSVKRANIEKVFSQGFEEGRIFNGYRFVYPIISQNKHLGSVEISVSMSAIINSLKEVYDKNYCFMIDSQVIDEKVFNDEKSNYSPSVFGHTFAVDKGVENEICRTPNTGIKKLVKEASLLRKLSNKEPISKAYRTNEGVQTIHLIPVQNVKGKFVAYLYTSYKDIKIDKLHTDFIYHLILTFIGFLFITFVLLILRKDKLFLEKQKSLLERKVQERTQEINTSLMKEKSIRKLLRTITDVNEQLNLASQIDSLLNDCCKGLKKNENFKFTHLKLLNGKYNPHIMTKIGKRPISEKEIEQFYHLIQQNPEITSALLQGEILIYKHLEKLNFTVPVKDFIVNTQIRTILFIPITLENIFIGFMSIFSTAYHEFEEEKIILKELGKTISKSILSLENKQLNKEMQLEKLKNYKEIIYALVDLTEKRDTYTAGHTRRVAKYSLLIAKQLGLSDDDLNLLEEAAMLHDIGKIVTPDSILLKPGKLSSDEYNIIQDHVTSGAEIINSIKSYKSLHNIMRYHHERYDGQGYPNGISGNEIPFLSRILTVADAFDAMTTNRIYKPRKNVEVALIELESGKGSQFDPEIIPMAIEALKEVEIDAEISQLPKSGSDYERLSYHFRDPLTGLYNKAYLKVFCDIETSQNEFRCVNIIMLNKFHEYNLQNGWEAGNRLLKEFAESLKDKFPKALLFRILGDDFVIVSFEHKEITDLSFDNFNLNYRVEHYDIYKKEDQKSLLELIEC